MACLIFPQTPEEYKRLYDLERGSEYSVYHGYAYDGIWVIAHALHRLLREEEMREGSNMAASLEELLRGARVGKALNDTNIRGVTVFLLEPPLFLLQVLSSVDRRLHYSALSNMFNVTASTQTFCFLSLHSCFLSVFLQHFSLSLWSRPLFSFFYQYLSTCLSLKKFTKISLRV